MRFKCENCGMVFDVNVIDWKDLANVRCPNCKSRCVVRIFQRAIVY